MNPPLTFDTSYSDLADKLPYNYLPAALNDIAMQPQSRGRRLFAVNTAPAGDEVRRDEAKSYMVYTATLQDPLLMAERLREIRVPLREDGPADHWFLGPPTDVAEDIDLAFAANPTNIVEGARCVAAIVDAGIAFWDPAFRTGSGSRFREMVYLDFDTANGLSQRLDQFQITEHCNLADFAGSQAVATQLGKSFPESFFGPGGAADPDRGWHGTGVADLMAGGVAEDQDDVAMFGFELPMSIIRDHDGDSLLAVLWLTIEMILSATDPLHDLPLVIVLPFGFVSGPHDGSHPAIKAVTNLIDQSGRKIDLVVPAGNHLQDRSVARFDPITENAPAPAQSVIWRQPPDDFSPNVVEAIFHGTGGNGTPALQITPPGGAATDVALSVGDLVLVQRGAHIVGALFRRNDTATVARVRFVLLGTGWSQAGVLPPPAGDWRIAVKTANAIDLYALRDDRDRAADKARPQRSAVFIDGSYRETDNNGAPLLSDDGASVVRRAGTASLLTTITGVIAVQADERLGAGPPQQAWYSGNRADGAPWVWSALVDDGWPSRGVDCAANGTSQRTRITGTSAAVGLHARFLIGLHARPGD